ncbi:mucin-2-like [Aphis gossypii]|uniref:mucin-2-like n=1 Tax=Aphis gossypii TaxID=80765 RepID=UPI0021596310|nr:mucin-2-like [Aphis gossypii]
MDQRQNPLHQAAELLERSQQLLRTANAETPRATTAARARRMPLEQLRRDPVLWAAYNRGWNDRTAAFRRVMDEPPVETHRSRSPRRHVLPAGMPRPPAIPPSAYLFRPPPLPLMATPVPRPPAIVTAPPTTTTATRTMTTTARPTTTVAAPPANRNRQRNHRQRRNAARLADFKAAKRTTGEGPSQQFRLQKTLPTTNPPPSTVTPNGTTSADQGGNDP